MELSTIFKQYGKLRGERKALNSYEVMVKDNQVYVKVTDNKFNW